MGGGGNLRGGGGHENKYGLKGGGGGAANKIWSVRGSLKIIKLLSVVIRASVTV